MKFTLTDEIPFERELVFDTYRDKLEELVPYLPNVTDIKITEKEVQGEVTRLLNLWTGASSDVPKPLRPVIKPEMLTWIDKAAWDRGRWRCDWEITLSALPEAITARGFNTYLDEGGETVIQMTGEFIVHPDRIKGVPAFVGRRLAPTLEKFVVGLLQPNLKRSNQAVNQYLEDHY